MSAPVLEEIIIRPIRGPEAISLKEVWRYRNLLWSLVVKDIRVKYDALHLGFMWPLVRPLMIALVVALFKNATSAITGEQFPYLLYVHAGVIFWFFFAETVNEVAGGLQRDAALLMKVYYPRIISPMVSLFSSLFELAIAAIPLVVMMFIYQEHPGMSFWLFPLVLLQLLLFTLGCGLILSYLSMHVRDFSQGVGLILYIGIFVSPVFHNVDILPQSLQQFSQLNPMVGTLNAFRSVLFEKAEFPWQEWGMSCLVTAAILAVGLGLFKRLQHKVVELL